MHSSTAVSESTSLSDDPLAGQPYRAIRLLGAGAMGEVYLAEDRRLATPCVVKIQHARLARDPSVADRIRLEADALSRLNHANIVSVLGSGRTLDERPFIVMEYLRGQTMADEFAARGRLPPAEALGYVCQLLRGLAAAHAIGIVHRDIKPDNLFLCDGPRGNRLLKVLDFGVACATPTAEGLGPNPLAMPTAPGTVVGALRYVSPEGALARQVDHRADLYSAALVLYFALAGRGPFDHIQSALLLLSAHVAEEPEAPSVFAKAPIPAALDQAVLRALRKAPSERFQSADELREELERIMRELPGSGEASAVRALPEGSRRDPDSSGSRIRSAPRVEAQAAPREPLGPLCVGSRFLDKYQIHEQIGRGGQAWVYHGEHVFTGREVAIKVVHSPRGTTHEMLERGKAEARALGKLDHPNIVVMHDAGVTDDGLFYIVMELLRGRSLGSALSAHGRFGIEEVLDISMSMAEALQAAHEIELIHRDLTPENVFLTRNNRVKVLDFGIAKMLNHAGYTTHKDIVMGSILYMSPEQVQGLPLTPRSDICALGLLMFEMLSGKQPSLLLFERDLEKRNEPARRAVLADIPPLQAYRTPPLLSDVDAHIPRELAQIVHRAIARNPEDRFATMGDFIAQIRAYRDAHLGDAEEIPAGGRDLSLMLAGEVEEAPASQRATPRRGLVWDGAGSLTPVPGPGEFGVTAVSGSVVAPREDRFSTTRRATRARTGWRKALLAACLTATFGSLALLGHVESGFPIASRAPAAPRATALPTATPDPVFASLSPALPVTSSEGPREPAPSPHADQAAHTEIAHPRPASPSLAAPRLPTQLARTRRAAATTNDSPKSVDAIGDVSLPVEVSLGSKSRVDQPSNAGTPHKRVNGGKLIYGD